MALFRFPSEPPSRPLIRTPNLYLRAPQASDHAAWALLRMESREFLTPWEPTWNEDDLTRASFRLRAKRAAREISTDEAYSLFIFETGTETLIGGLTLGLIRRGVAQACTLGYWMGRRHAGKGHMTEAVRGAVRFAFSDLALHRVEAACLPNNEPSRRLLERVGFQHEGLARAYLKINGNWADHLLYAALSTDTLPGSRP
ncbi:MULTISPECIES: GNAT family N-acetyltransferase [Bosea]|uniref:GNAT family N-acetyltransferase n=1 Tax=Bosea TaxID=85413 RepID=UPI0021503E72|nr:MULTISPECIES: GNAT family protein [Bosea]MCR4521303.1 GNAT family N-acetyltransferase [Bosea sp. 47.2.35]MDR6826727.1 ribosomal-protein-alanine N-acetyltransferase [Bosea robiniae]MDR6893437.1 ribosomal-protein-alanine N-acetyltransferase [Bosea sp. BE109]MDR7136864.1 ribosomal-protein-alanine N-acetyltransferase [Bosea sp. BE168]MDR7173563.1 ribosomal-protein-alanine N-acetyltransferase [Bosea sp. BE271]